LERSPRLHRQSNCWTSTDRRVRRHLVGTAACLRRVEEIQFKIRKEGTTVRIRLQLNKGNKRKRPTGLIKTA